SIPVGEDDVALAVEWQIQRRRIGEAPHVERAVDAARIDGAELRGVQHVERVSPQLHARSTSEWDRFLNREVEIVDPRSVQEVASRLEADAARAWNRECRLIELTVRI